MYKGHGGVSLSTRYSGVVELFGDPVCYTAALLSLAETFLHGQMCNNRCAWRRVTRIGFAAIFKPSSSFLHVIPSLFRRSFYFSRQHRKISYNKHAQCWTFLKNDLPALRLEFVNVWWRIILKFTGNIKIYNKIFTCGIFIISYNDVNTEYRID